MIWGDKYEVIHLGEPTQFNKALQTKDTHKFNFNVYTFRTLRVAYVPHNRSTVYGIDQTIKKSDETESDIDGLRSMHNCTTNCVAFSM